MSYMTYNVCVVKYPRGNCLNKLVFYVKENGRCPIQEFLLILEKPMRTKAITELELLKLEGHNLREPHVKYIKDGLYELRIKTGSNISRIFYFFHIENEIILTNGFIKKTNKLPSNEIEKAIDYKEEYIRRFEYEKNYIYFISYSFSGFWVCFSF